MRKPSYATLSRIMIYIYRVIRQRVDNYESRLYSSYGVFYFFLNFLCSDISFYHGKLISIFCRFNQPTMSTISTAIYEPLQTGKTRSDIIKLLKPRVSRSGVHKVLRSLRETGSTLPKVRSAQSRRVRTPNIS